MNHDEIRAALAAATPGPLVHLPSMQADTFIYLRDDIIAGPTYRRSRGHLIANAPTWLAELLAEVDALTARAEAAERAVQRVRDLAEHYDGLTYANLSRAILGVLDGGAS